MDMEEMMRMSGQGRDEILCENFDRHPAYDERSRHGSPYADFDEWDDDECDDDECDGYDDDEYGMDAWECANHFECGYGRAEI